MECTQICGLTNPEPNCPEVSGTQTILSERYVQTACCGLMNSG